MTTLRNVALRIAHGRCWLRRHRAVTIAGGIVPVKAACLCALAMPADIVALDQRQTDIDFSDVNRQ